MALNSKWLCVFMLYDCVFRVLGGITTVANITMHQGVDKEARFFWNTTTGASIDEAKWGLFDGTNDVVPFFIKVNTLVKGPQLSPDLDNGASRYKNRVHFTGNITAGHAWFILTNLSTLDTNEYAATIKESGAGFKLFRVKLTVMPPPTTSPPTTITTKGHTKETVCQLKLPNDKYVDELSDPKGKLFQSYIDKITKLVRDVFKSMFVSVRDFKFVKGSVIVIFKLTLIGIDDPLAVLKEAVVKNNGTLHGLTIDPDSIKEGPYVSSTTAQTPSNTPKPGGLKAGEIVGIVFGVVAVIVIAIIVVYFVKKSKNNGNNGSNNKSGPLEMDKPAGDGNPTSPEA